ncbi:hypothetical protein F2Q69_00052991 [Brassica cretica]|uniref:Uncharacterized protein n=1 Tax=Brassica cretica TaxID=69181 RepID=A0A8S9N3F3_BRACR|nr:hypothetical protein F2Q69_00052991 [Brassica cretica]
MSELATQMFGVVRGPRDVCASDADDVSAGHLIPRWATPLLFTPPSFPLSGFQPDVREMDDVTVWQIAHVCISFVSRVRRLSVCGCVTLLPPPKLQAIAPRVFVLEIMWHGYFVNSWGSLLDLGCGSLRCVDIGVMLFILGVPIYSETRQRDGASFLRCYPLDGLAVTTSSSVGVHKGKSSDSWSGA